MVGSLPLISLCRKRPLVIWQGDGSRNLHQARVPVTSSFVAHRYSLTRWQLSPLPKRVKLDSSFCFESGLRYFTKAASEVFQCIANDPAFFAYPYLQVLPQLP